MSDVSVMGRATRVAAGSARGACWDSPSFRPKDWAILEQVKHIPAEWDRPVTGPYDDGPCTPGCTGRCVRVGVSA
jgi:hypothetical protein